MKATANREGLLTAFQVASSVVASRSPKPILTCVKLCCEGDQAILMATDLEVGIRYRVSGLSFDQPGSAVLPASETIAILRELSDESLELELGDRIVTMRGASSRFNLNSPEPEQFPEVPDAGEESGAVIVSQVLATMIRRTLFAIAEENSRYQINSVLLELDGDQARMIATDGKRLAHMPGAARLRDRPPERTTLIPPKALALVQKILVDPEEEVELCIRENEILFRTAKVTIYSRLTDGRFPPYREVFPPEAKWRARITVGAFLGVLRQAKIVTRNETKGVDFHFEQDRLTLSSRGPDVGESEIRLPVGYEGDPLDITFDPQFFIDALRVLDPAEEVSLEMIDSRKATVLRTHDDYAYLVMPLTRERG